MKFISAVLLVALIPVRAVCGALPLSLEDCGQIWLTPNLDWTLIVRTDGSATLKYAASLSAKEVPAQTLDFGKVYSCLRATDTESNGSVSVNLVVKEAKRAANSQSAFPMVAELSPEIREVFAAFLAADGIYELPEVKKFTFQKNEPRK